MKTTLKLFFFAAIALFAATAYGQDTQKKLLGSWVSVEEKMENGEKTTNKTTWTFDNDSIYTVNETVKTHDSNRLKMNFPYKLKEQVIVINMMGTEVSLAIKELTDEKFSIGIKGGDTEKIIGFTRGKN